VFPLTAYVAFSAWLAGAGGLGAIVPHRYRLKRGASISSSIGSPLASALKVARILSFLVSLI